MAESKTWNGSGQLASISLSSYALSGGMQYSYSATQNNGQITQAVDTFSGETIVYQYDLLKRLVSSSATPTSGSTPAPWTETFQYDGFGNLTAKVLNGTSTPIPVNAATNQLTNAYYDANGNMTSGAGASFTYDTSNRIASATAASGGNYTNEYAPDNKRIHRTVANSTPPVNEWTFYGAAREKLGVYQLVQGTDEYGNAYAYFAPVWTSVWFGGKLVNENGPVNLDRLGTNHAQNAQFLPYGDEITSTSNDRTKFATYTRDSYTGLDYADQRFYASIYGNFTSPDPSMDNVDYKNPLSWNAYSYTMGDPINGNDPSGLVTCGNLQVEGGATLSSYYNTTTDACLLTEFVWSEGGSLLANGNSQSAMLLSQETIAQAIENRLSVAKGLVAVVGADGNFYWGNGGTASNGMTIHSASALGFGNSTTTLAQELVLAAAGTSELNSSGQLNDMSGITSTLNTDLGDPTRDLPGRVPVTLTNGTVDYVTPECDRAISAMQATNTILGGATLNQPGYFVTNWKANGNSNPDPARFETLGSVGGTTFYGFNAYFYMPTVVRRPPPGRR